MRLARNIMNLLIIRFELIFHQLSVILIPLQSRHPKDFRIIH